MASVLVRKSRPAKERYPELHSGDRLTRAEFHRIYERTSETFRAELIGGIVYIASPPNIPHGSNHAYLSAIMTNYAWRTPGVQVLANATVFLADDAEVQPDLTLRILPEYGGRTRTTADECLAGSPEWISEIAHSSSAIDLHAKKDDYQSNGVLEYLVLCLREQQLRWFDLQAGKELQPDADGVLRMRVFPGLWINEAALFGRDYEMLMKTLDEGLGTPEHATFVKELGSKITPGKKGQHQRKKI